MKEVSRRAWLAGLGLAAGAGLGAAARGLGAATPRRRLLRPPGAAGEAELLAACIRCGQCVEACPYGTLEPASWREGMAMGSPHVRDARDVPCYLCRDHEELLCIAACPTGALREVAGIESIRMGVAEIDEETCLAHQGVVCRVCWHTCPLPGGAIRFGPRLRPVVDADTCIGCGICEHACLTDPASIRVRPAGEGG